MRFLVVTCVLTAGLTPLPLAGSMPVFAVLVIVAGLGLAPSTAAAYSLIGDLTPASAVTESYSSHGAYVRIGDVRAYVPLRFLGDPPPRSAREVLAVGATAPFVVVSFNAPRRGIDLAAPGFVPEGIAAPLPKKWFSICSASHFRARASASDSRFSLTSIV